MPKLKTVKAVSKRIKVTKKDKVIIRKGGQDHFNTRESGKTMRNKRRDIKLAKANKKNIKKFIPYN